jgi:ABC-2 type transport system ATP-binding protein
MAQKVQFIAAVIARPRLLILDEPFAGLDPVNLDVLKDAVLSLRASGTTVVFSTHDMHIAEKLCDTVFMIFEGRKVLDGSLAEIRRSRAAGRVRLRLAGGGKLPADLAGVSSAARADGFHELSIVGDAPPHAVLRQLANRCEVEHFEIVRPTLHDIFVEIARPQGADPRVPVPEGA